MIFPSVSSRTAKRLLRTYVNGEGTVVSDLGNCRLDKWNQLIKLAKSLRRARSQQNTSRAPETNTHLSKLCYPGGSCFFLNGWAEATTSALLWLGCSLGLLRRASRERSSSLVCKWNRRTAENLHLLHHTELGGNGSAFFILKKSKTTQSTSFPGVKLRNKVFSKYLLFDY